MRWTSSIVPAMLLSMCWQQADARPWTLTDVAANLGFTDRIEVAQTGAVLFNENYADLVRDSMEQAWFVRNPDGTVRQFPRGLRISNAHWAPDGRRLVALAELKDGSGQLFWVDARTFAVTRLTRGASIATFSVSPDGSLIAAIETESLARPAIHMSYWFTDNTDVLGARPPSRHLVIIDAKTGARRRAVTDSYSYGGPVTDHDPAWSPDGATVAVVRQPTPLYGDFEAAEYVGVDVRDGRVSRLTPNGIFALPQTAQPAYSASGRLATVRTWDNRFDSREDIFIDNRNVSAGIDRDFWSCGQSRTAWGGEQLFGTALDGTDMRLYRLDADGSAAVPVTPPGGSVDAFAVGASGEVYIMYSTPESPDELYRIEADGSIRQLTHRHHLPSDLSIAKTSFPSWSDGHGRKLIGQLTQSGGAKQPLLVELHGGPQCADSSAFSAFAQYYATNGYAYFRPNPRGSDGYGDWSYKSIVNDWGPGPMIDVMAGVDAVASGQSIDPGREFIYGASYGGYLTSWIVTHSDRFQAAVAAIPVTDLTLDYTLSQSPNIQRRFFGRRPVADNAGVLFSQSPVQYASAVHTPLMLIAGLKDTQAPYPQTIHFFKILRELGKECELLAYPDDGHGPNNPRAILDWTAHVVGWFAAHNGLQIPDALAPPSPRAAAQTL